MRAGGGCGGAGCGVWGLVWGVARVGCVWDTYGLPGDVYCLMVNKRRRPGWLVGQQTRLLKHQTTSGLPRTILGQIIGQKDRRGG